MQGSTGEDTHCRVILFQGYGGESVKTTYMFDFQCF
jgi:hypothetical protein